MRIFAASGMDSAEYDVLTDDRFQGWVEAATPTLYPEIDVVDGEPDPGWVRAMQSKVEQGYLELFDSEVDGDGNDVPPPKLSWKLVEHAKGGTWEYDMEDGDGDLQGVLVVRELEVWQP